MQRLAPHLAAGLKAATLSAASPAWGDGPGVLVLDDRGRVVQHTPSAERWLREWGELGSGWRDGHGLPDAVWLAVGALRHALDAATERDLARVPCVATRTPAGRWLRLQPALAEARDDAPAETVIVIEPAGARELAWLQTAAYGLTVRERDVVDLVVRGASTREIATSLCIAEYTVQDHLSHIFEKVGVRGRRALLQRLYFDSLDPVPAKSGHERRTACDDPGEPVDARTHR